jgi:hypothetical protein
MLAGRTSQPDVGAQAHDRPIVATARVRLSQPNDISEVDFDELGGAHHCL